jgi:hypothetical protein
MQVFLFCAVCINTENEKNSYKKSKNVIKHRRKPSKNVRKLKISKKA